MAVLFESKKVEDFVLVKETCEGYAQNTSEVKHSGEACIKLAITDMKNNSRSLIRLRKRIDEFKDIEKYPDLYFSFWRMIPPNSFFEERNGTMSLGRMPWEWFYNIQDNSTAWNFRTGTSIQYRQSLNKWFTVGASLEDVVSNIRTSLFPVTDLFDTGGGVGKAWSFGVWFRVQWHIHRSLDPSEGYMETWIDDIQIGETHYAKTAYDDVADPNKKHNLELFITNYITGVESQFYGKVPIISYIDDIVISEEYVPLDYTVGQQEPAPEEDNRFLLPLLALLGLAGLVLISSFKE